MEMLQKRQFSSSSSTNGRHLEKGIKPSSVLRQKHPYFLRCSYNKEKVHISKFLFSVSQDFTKLRKTLSSSCENVVSFSQNSSCKCFNNAHFVVGSFKKCPPIWGGTHTYKVKHYSYDSFATFFSEIKCMIFPCPSIMIVAWRVFRHNNMFFNLLFDDKK